MRFPDAGRRRLPANPDRVRETLFNWLGQDLTGRRCLDVFSGSGALAFEAASRATQVVAIESSRVAAQAIAQNQKLLDLPNLKLVNGDAFAFLASTPEKFDVVFLDPPFAQDWWQRLAPLVSRVAAPDALIYCEFAKELTGRECLASTAAVMIAPAWCTIICSRRTSPGPQSPATRRASVAPNAEDRHAEMCLSRNF